MSDEPSSQPDLSAIDLSLSFAPAWAKEADAPEKFARLADKHGADRPERGDRRDDRGRGGPDRRPARPGSANRAGGNRGNSGKRPDRRDDRRPERRSEAPPPPTPVVNGWDVHFLADTHGVEGVAKQIKSSAKAYPLFDLARLVLEKSERYLVELKRTADDATPIFQLKADGSLWLREADALAAALAGQLEKFYRRERVATEAPKGIFPFVAVCGMSGTLLGPPNYHDYQTKLIRLHAERFANVPFEVFKSRIRMEREESFIEKWKEEQSTREEFYPLNSPEMAEGAEPVKLASMADVERHFRENYASGAVERIRDRVVAPGPAAMNDSAPAILDLTRGVWDQLQRFPLPLAHTLGQQLTSKGLQIFKTSDNITCVGVARPRYLDRQATPVSDALSAMLDYLEASPGAPRGEQWKTLIALRPIPDGGTASDRDAAVAADLLWLLHEGHVIDFARSGLEAARRPKPRPEGDRKPKANVKREPQPVADLPPTPDSPAAPANAPVESQAESPAPAAENFSEPEPAEPDSSTSDTETPPRDAEPSESLSNPSPEVTVDDSTTEPASEVTDRPEPENPVQRPNSPSVEP